MPMSSPLLLLLIGAAASAATDPDVLVTGATGRTGQLIYRELKARRGAQGGGVRALVTDLAQARSVLNCSLCDASEGIFLGDVTDPSTLAPAFAGVGRVAIAVGFTSENASEAAFKAVEYTGVINQVAALTNATANPAAAAAAAAAVVGGGAAGLRVAIVSSAGTTVANPSPQMGGPILFWKLNAEAFLGSAVGALLTATIAIKPGGLDSPRAGPRLLVAPATDALCAAGQQGVARADVARVLVAALEDDTLSGGLRLDLGSTQGAPTTDDELGAVIRGGLWPWQQGKRKGN
jgi:uncharacterized protein YbjT (DUF2867 family)